MSKTSLTLLGHYVELEILNETHNLELSDIVSETSLCFHNQTFIPTPELMPTYIKRSKQATQNGTELPFVIIDKISHKVVGSIKLENLHGSYAEIGSTFISVSHQGTYINSEAKLILMQHAFETLNLQYISFIVHEHNIASIKALHKLGITQYSYFSHLKTMPMWENSSYKNYTLKRSDWESIKKKLQIKLFS